MRFGQLGNDRVVFGGYDVSALPRSRIDQCHLTDVFPKTSLRYLAAVNQDGNSAGQEEEDCVVGASLLNQTISSLQFSKTQRSATFPAIELATDVVQREIVEDHD